MNLSNRIDLPVNEQGEPVGNVEKHNQKLRQEITAALNAGIKDIDQAIHLGPPSAELYYHAACLHAEQVRNGTGSKEIALQHLEEAVKRGMAPLKIANDITLTAPLGNEAPFKKLLERPAPLRAPAPAVRVVDPIAGATRQG